MFVRFLTTNLLAMDTVFIGVMVRSKRFVSLMAYLQENQQVTAKHLAQHLGVSERTVYRDIDHLTQSGVPIQRKSGVGGGVSLPEKYRASLQHILETSMQTTTLADKKITSELTAIAPTLPKVDSPKPYVHVDTRGWFQFDNDLTTLPKLQIAVQAKQVIRVKYDDKTATLHPYGLVVRGSVWYLVAKQRKNMRILRVSQIKKLTVTENTFTPDLTFDLSKFWEESGATVSTTIQHYPVQARVQHQILSFFQHYFDGRFTVLDRMSGGRFATISVMFYSMMEAKAAILGLGNTIKVITPIELHDEIVKTANALVDFHGLGANQRFRP